MYKAKTSSNITNAFSFSKYQSQILNFIGFIILSLISTSSFAFLANPGANCDGVADAAQGALTNGDYNNLVASFGTYVNVAGNDGGKIPLQMRVSTSESSTSTVANNLSVISAPSNGSTFNAINVNRNFPSNLDFTTITLDFRNSITSQPIFLTNVALSAFDIDYANSNGNLFDDFIQITGTTQSGAIINGTFQSIAGSNVINANGLNNATATNCPAKNLEARCQGSIQFNQAVNNVIIRYTNNPVFVTRTPTNQEIDFRLDNYCYVPQYIFSGTVFDDNGGITAAQASATNANFNSGTYNNTNYFNGVFNPPQETGISGSTVRLASCDSNNPLTYATQTVNSSGATIGQFQFSVPLSTFGSNRSICLIESRTGSSYPIRTTTDNINTAFATTTYHYPNRNFGRVIAENAALVLRKAQYVNNCPSTILYTDPDLNRVGETDLRNGFSESANNGNALTPGQCIAYRITATNRANVPITNFVMQDKLQSKSDGAAVTSTLANPVASTTDYASNSVAIGNNGTVITNSFTLNATSNRNFYFNTKYGTTANTQ
tara:strand:+ start:3528 stop:5174 length:1647 start_codon:yes stop_codon:yes gene_type:complete